MTGHRRNVVTEADKDFEATAQRRNKERMQGLNNVRSVYGAPLPRLGHYKVK